VSRDSDDCVVVGASFAGLACASALARAGLRVTVLEKKSDAGGKLHTTGIIVKDAIDQVALLDGMPGSLVHRVSGVRLYAPNLRYVDLAAPGYYFLATDTPDLMRWLAARTEDCGARIAYRTPFSGATRIQSGFEIESHGPVRYLVGADVSRSAIRASSTASSTAALRPDTSRGWSLGRACSRSASPIASGARKSRRPMP
jgi:digeranylgeranylglycerophospholipid reductase